MESVLKIGSINEVKGRNVIIKVDKTKNSSHLIFNGEIINNVSVGSYVKITKGFNEIIGKIEGEYISEDKIAYNKDYLNNRDKIKRFLNVSLVGFIEQNQFKQGLKELPLIENECYLLTQNEFDCIHSFAKQNDDKIKIGTLLNETSVEIKLGVDKLFASHIGIFGNTGSGKSYSLAKIFHELIFKYKDFDKFKENAKFVLIDFNGEYALNNKKRDNIIIDYEYKSNYFLSTNKDNTKSKFPIKKEIIYDTTFWSILLRATEQTQKPFLENTFSSLYLKDKIDSESGIKELISNNLKLLLTQVTSSQDKNFHMYFLDELLKFGGDKIFTNLSLILKDDYEMNLKFWADKNDKSFRYNNSGTIIYANSDLDNFIQISILDKVNLINVCTDEINEFQRIRLMIIFNFFFVIQKGYYNKEHIGPLYGRLEYKVTQANKVFKIVDDLIDDEQVLTVISLRNVNIEMRKLIPLVVSKQYYDVYKNKKQKGKYLNLIIDEAHNILSQNSIRESETWKDYRLETFEEIIKEGRKFGVFLTIASQRPSDISDTIISQLHNYFLHRLINNKDIEAIGKTVSYLDKVSFDSLSILPQGACILAGLSADLPVVIKIDKIDDIYKPYNETIVLTKNWK